MVDRAKSYENFEAALTAIRIGPTQQRLTKAQARSLSFFGSIATMSNKSAEEIKDMTQLSVQEAQWLEDFWSMSV